MIHEPLALVDGKIYPSPDAPAIEKGTVILNGGKIVKFGKSLQSDLPAGAKRIDCSGYTIVSGFQNSHVHLVGEFSELLKDEINDKMRSWFTRYGFTTVVDTGSNILETSALRSSIRDGAVLGPRILTAGSPLYPRDGVPFYLRDTLPKEVLDALPQPSTPDAARAIVRENIAQGADITKLFTGSLVGHQDVKPMDLAIAKSAVQETHRLGKLVFTHPSNHEGIRVALDSGVDVLAHTASEDSAWTRELVDEMVSKKMALIPTLKLWLYEAEKYGATKDEAQEFAGRCVNQLAAFARGGGTVLFGTDAGYMTDYDPTKEYELMSKAGIDCRRLLRSLTTGPAALFGQCKVRGSIQSGMSADIVVLKADPETDIRNFSNVVYTIRNGQIIFDSNE